MLVCGILKGINQSLTSLKYSEDKIKDNKEVKTVKFSKLKILDPFLFEEVNKKQLNENLRNTSSNG